MISRSDDFGRLYIAMFPSIENRIRDGENCYSILKEISPVSFSDAVQKGLEVKMKNPEREINWMIIEGYFSRTGVGPTALLNPTFAGIEGIAIDLMFERMPWLSYDNLGD